MKDRGFVGGPFQLLIGVIVMGMALILGFFLINWVSCWRCNETLKVEVSGFKAKIENVGAGDVGTVETELLELPDCGKGIYLKHVEPGAGFDCSQACPQHPMSCWFITGDSRCSGRLINDCIDVSGDTIIQADPTIAQLASGTGDPWIDGSIPFTSESKHLRIRKIETLTGKVIMIDKP
jgi:hypothetical protein